MGLVQYDSSDEDEEVQTPVERQPPKPPVQASLPNTKNAAPPPPPPSPPAAPQQAITPSPAPNPSPGPVLGPVLGPALGPSRPPANPSASEQPQNEEGHEEIDLSFLSPSQEDPTTTTATTSPPRSPHTRTRTLIHNLTLPSLPNMDIPPSPPGTPPPQHDALTEKFHTFLRLKRTKGVHFNERLAGASGMKNPAVMDKLLKFVGVETEFDTAAAAAVDGAADGAGGGEGGSAGGGGRAVEQYATVLSAEVWDPACFPAWAYRGPLRRAQERASKERERARGEPVEFVAAAVSSSAAAGAAAAGGGGVGSAGRSRSGTPGVGGKRGLKGKWDT